MKKSGLIAGVIALLFSFGALGGLLWWKMNGSKRNPKSAPGGSE